VRLEGAGGRAAATTRRIQIGDKVAAGHMACDGCTTTVQSKTELGAEVNNNGTHDGEAVGEGPERGIQSTKADSVPTLSTHHRSPKAKRPPLPTRDDDDRFDRRREQSGTRHQQAAAALPAGHEAFLDHFLCPCEASALLSLSFSLVGESMHQSANHQSVNHRPVISPCADNVIGDGIMKSHQVRYADNLILLHSWWVGRKCGFYSVLASALMAAVGNPNRHGPVGIAI
jgi:hypothetical protein